MVGDDMCFETISAKALTTFMHNANYILLDLREYSDYQRGHIPSAICIPYDELMKNMTQLDIQKKYILYCDRGSMSMLAAKELCTLGYVVVNVYGGIHAYRGVIER
ncbi:rhodanese-like domain-containing protein [Anaerosporobacter faecicola]|uniref:rhodanese-like domain-containing protein n=1 Tax=Anaerosporobacter faecicola TaxID=2718714 RepID=UPI001439E6BD|nr:rhodanese-like domain-containing protein [Anaerosporobacter faecicola]